MSGNECNGQLSPLLVVSSLIGLLLSIYTTHVEIQLESDHDYEALCDLNAKISCTKVFSSRYGRGFGIINMILEEDSILNQPNGLFGVFFYTLMALLSFVSDSKVAQVQVILCVISNILSLYLAYLLYFILEDFCIVCVSTYVINAANLYFSTKRYKKLLYLENKTKKDDDKIK
ncbi:Vitamin-K-epoxide reductase (warfarin-sensitive) [Sergentomyia squamirostris]